MILYASVSEIGEIMDYTDPKLVTDTKRTPRPKTGQTVSGYGGKIPTNGMVRYAGRWHRIYVMLYSNHGTAYIVSKGKRLVLDVDTEHAI